ncbi:spore germination protein [Paenibacillus sedimenti]|uniref:Spore germination protein n=1 Tax=Paenibacillus sedimenti TaxID=2770274 RepID=A0A926KSX5_9BACL|nr:spore germination protein [Paenibacillus sedimenti]MBD0382927.1 spore germination protein [Paenibacillus sedimenti]
MFPWNKYRSKGRVFSGKTGAEGGHPLTGKLPLQPSLADNLQHLLLLLGTSPDITIRQFEVGSSRTQVAAVFTDGITDKNMVNEFILHALLIDMDDRSTQDTTADKPLFNFIKTNALMIGEIEIKKDWDGVILSILSGDTVIFVDGCTEALVCGTRGGEMRGVEEPSAQVVIRGPKDGFTESIGTNVALVRRRIRSSHLRLTTMQVGRVTQTDVAVMYINGLANDKIVQEIMKRLSDIEFDSILESGYIEQLIEDNINTPFPTMYNTERPDSVAGNLLEGRIAIFVDGTPFVLLAPATFFMFFQATEDYYQQYIIASAIRLLRYAAFLISIFGPSIYIAAITFHQEMIPTQLLISLAAQRDTVPFPALVEALIMEVAFEILREAGIRMPRAIGQAVSIVGALVLGQAAVEAGIISSAMVIVVSITGISSFSTPAYGMALSARLLRFTMMISAAILGFYGVAIVSIIAIGHLCGLRSFGIPYMAPLAPLISEDHKDILIRFPIKNLFSRPRLISQKNTMRMGESEGHAAAQNIQTGRKSP